MNENAIKDFIDFYNKEDYFNCHEVLEETWRSEDLSLNKDCGYVCLIQFAVCMYHLKNENYLGFEKMKKNLNSHYVEFAKKEIDFYFENFDFCFNKLFKIQHYEFITLNTKV